MTSLKSFDPGIRLLIIACAICASTLVFHGLALSGWERTLRWLLAAGFAVAGYLVAQAYRPPLVATTPEKPTE